MQIMRCMWKFWPNLDSATVNLDRRLPRISMRIFRDFPGSQPLSNRDANFVSDLESIDGVVGVSMHDYEIHVFKGSIFSWDEIRPAFDARVAEYFGVTLEVSPDAGHINLASGHDS